jgi:hypothetical protein
VIRRSGSATTSVFEQYLTLLETFHQAPLRSAAPVRVSRQ